MEAVFGKKRSEIALTTVYRLSYYYRALAEPGASGFISSKELAKLTGIKDALVRRDLSYFGRFGIPGKGYPVESLKNKITGILGVNRKWKVALVGLGNLGSALLKYKGFQKHDFQIVALFDNDPNKIGKIRCGIEVYSINDLKKEVKKKGIEMGIVAVPAEPAQEVIDSMVASGIKAILNFAPVKAVVKEPASLVNIDMTVELERLSFLANNLQYHLSTTTAASVKNSKASLP